MGEVLDRVREELGVLQGLIDAAHERGVPEDDPALRNYVRALRSRGELLEELEQFAPRAPRRPAARVNTTPARHRT